MNRSFVLATVLSLAAQAGGIPPGFTPIFNGRNLDGWHISAVSDHGNTKGWRVENGVITVTQDTPGNGGILLTDKKFKDFEIYLEVNPDYGCDGGLFLRSNERGQAYQVTLDYLDGGSIGGVYGEGLSGVATTPASGWQAAWRKGDWNSLRVRMEGAVPHITVWLNGARILDWTDTANHAAGGASDGMIALQSHGGKKRWIPGGFHRFRNIAVKVF